MTEAAPTAPWPRSRANRRHRVPSILQMEATECGAASLCMVLAGYRRWVALEEMRVACGVSRDGSKASRVVQAARDYGLQAKGYRCEPRELATQPMPAIVFWNFNHFLVVEGIDTRRGVVWLNDPVDGPRRITLEEFDRGFTGVALLFTPGPGFVRGGTPPRLIGPLIERLRGSGPALSFLLVATLALVIPGLVIPVFSSIFVDTVLVQQMRGWLSPMLIGMGLTAVLRGGLVWLQQTQLARLEHKLSLNTSAAFLWHVLRLPVSFFAQRHAGDLSARLGANDKVAQLLSGQLATNAVGLVSIAFYAAMMASYDVTLTAIGVGLALFNLALLRAGARVRGDGSRRLLKSGAALASASVSGLTLMETLKAGGTESDFFMRWAGLQANYLNAQQENASRSILLESAPVLLSALANAAILGLGGLRVMSGDLTVGDIVAFQSLFGSFNAPIAGLMAFGGALQTITADLARLDDVFKHPLDGRLTSTASVLSAGAAPTSKLSGLVEVRGLVFGYSRLEPPLLDGIDLTLRPGQRVALVGGSGSGKSTVAKLITGLYRPWAGEIRFDGLPLETIPYQHFVASVASVDQELFLLKGSVRDNVSLWAPTLTDADITQALRDAALLDAIVIRPGRLDAEVCEGGTNFSGGQRQRLEIARALVNRPSVLVLDEATSALDPLVEQLIDDALRRRGCTCLIVAHRLSMRWPRNPGQGGGLNKLGSRFGHAALWMPSRLPT